VRVGNYVFHLVAIVLVQLALNAEIIGDEATTDTFEGGINNAGWAFAPWDVIESSGGNPGAWLHNDFLDTFAPIVASDWEIPNAFQGDFRATRVTGISVDAITIARDFGNPVGYEFSIVLRDMQGTADFDDDDYAYFVGSNVPLIGEGWVGMEFLIPSQSTDSVPAGWRGGWAGDGENFRPGVDWNDVITSVDRVEFWWINPANFAIFATWDVGIDNASIKRIPEPGAALALTVWLVMSVCTRRRRGVPNR
jgi:hypothetical protein